ncbi:PASTA domain-containing protein [Gimesia sp.]|uniref:PASTA domain-containing protein n=1 Tax=Gimesia sp. TaxID=2024833 RepID=UPI0032EEDCE1
MKSKPVLHQSALTLFSWAILTLLVTASLEAQVDQRKPRPDPADAVMQVQELPKALEDILAKWEKESGKINKLEGEHVRIWYDDVFCVEKRSEGKFYYEKPDKGRIDITGMKIGKNAKPGKVNPKTGKPFILQPGENEKWICDGHRIFKIDEDEKAYEVFPIPLERRGANIMEGPLPFLFGMPAKTAKQRYYLKLIDNSPQQIVIAVKPRRRADAANYQEAKVLLDPNTYLPRAVQLIHPGGNQSTVYSFQKVEANKARGIIATVFGNSPFTPDLEGYQLQGKVVAQADGGQELQPAPQQQIAPIQHATFKVPNMVGHDFKSARKVLEDMGLKPQFHRGDPAGQPKLIYQVYQQVPVPGSAAQKGQTIHLKLYVDPSKAQN